jgi:hypothetical protein
MLANLNRALQVQVADALRARLRRSNGTGLPLVEALTIDDQRDLSAAGAGRVAAVAIRIGGHGGVRKRCASDGGAGRDAAAASRAVDRSQVVRRATDGPGVALRETDELGVVLHETDESGTVLRETDEPGAVCREVDAPATVLCEPDESGALLRETDEPGAVRREPDGPGALLREVAHLVQDHVRRTDVLLGLAADTLLVLAPGLDAVTGHGLAGRLERLLAERGLEAAVGVASRSPASHPDWTPQSLAGEAQQRAS